MRIDDELIDDTLRDGPTWNAPAGFARNTAARGVELLRDDFRAPRFWSWGNIADAIPVAAITAIGLYLAGELVSTAASLPAVASVPAPEVPWVWVAAALAVAGWFTLMPHAAD
jgi:hypothetical protein